MICTSYFDNAAKLKAEGYSLVSIAGWTPKELEGSCEKMKLFMPKYTWWKEWHDMFALNLEASESIEWYVRQYENTVLANVTADDIEKLKQRAATEKLCLLCYETPNRFCHRHLVAKFLREHGISCNEIDFSSQEKAFAQ